ncbi:hypothetical protein PV325_005407 [Microctonus aethiopoides]|nr:hypothetical protein PV325_005407 [Microctonus aethiopoides]
MSDKMVQLDVNDTYYYVAVKGSPFATDCTVFGLSSDEVCALCKRFPNSGSEIVNGVMIKGPPISIINTLAELGYRVISSTGDAEPRFILKENNFNNLLHKKYCKIKIMADKYLHNHNHSNTCCKTVVTGVSQTLDEMDFERGIWHAEYLTVNIVSTALYNDMPRLMKLLHKGVSPDIEDLSGYTALHYAARAGHYDICKKLLDMGANPDVQTRCGKTTPLHRAAMHNHYNIIKLLTDHGANLNIEDADGNTVTHYLALYTKPTL